MEAQLLAAAHRRAMNTNACVFGGPQPALTTYYLEALAAAADDPINAAAIFRAATAKLDAFADAEPRDHHKARAAGQWDVTL